MSDEGLDVWVKQERATASELAKLRAEHAEMAKLLAYVADQRISPETVRDARVLLSRIRNGSPGPSPRLG
jgi:hypothetical protein